MDRTTRFRDMQPEMTMALESAIVVLTAYFYAASGVCLAASFKACASALSPGPLLTRVSTWLNTSRNRDHDFVQRGARAHSLARQFDVRAIVAADIHRLALCGTQFFEDLRFVVGHRLGY